ncbi:MAG: hypothetical protein WCP28_16590 [Actinomycetes bacterium]
MDNETFVGDDGIVYHIAHGDQTDEVARQNALAMTAAVRSGPFGMLLVDLSDAGDVSRGARNSYKDFQIQMTAPGTEPPLHICFAGGGVFIRTVAKFVSVAAGRKDVVTFRPTREDAKDWLLSHDPSVPPR